MRVLVEKTYNYVTLNLKKNKYLIVNSSYFYVSYLLEKFVGIFIMGVIIRKIGITDFGLYSLINSFSAFLNNLLEIRGDEALVFFLSRYKDKRELIISLSIFYQILAFLIALSVVIILAPFIKTIYFKSKVSTKILILGFSLIPITFWEGSLKGFIQFKENFLLYNVLGWIDKIIFWSLIIISVKINIEQIFLYRIASKLGYLVVAYLYIIFKFDDFKINVNNVTEIFKKEKKLAKEFFKTSFNNFFSTLIKAGNKNIDNIILGYFLSSSLYGVYTVLERFARIIRFIGSPINIITYPRLSKLAAKREYSKILQVLVRWGVLLFAISMSLSILIYLFWEPILQFVKIDLRLIESNMHNYRLILFLILSVEIIRISLWGSRKLPLALGRSDIPIKTNFIQSLISLTIGIFLIWRYQIIGLIVNSFLKKIVGYGYVLLSTQIFKKSIQQNI